MMTSICIHLREETPVKAKVRCDYAVINLDGGNAGMSDLFFTSEEHLRSFAESILKQLDAKKVQTA